MFQNGRLSGAYCVKAPEKYNNISPGINKIIPQIYCLIMLVSPKNNRVFTKNLAKVMQISDSTTNIIPNILILFPPY